MKKPFVIISILLSIFSVLFFASKLIKHNSKKKSQSSPHERVHAKKPPILHPFLLAFFPALSLVSDNAALLTVNKTIVGIALITLFINSLCFYLLRSLLKNGRKAGSIVSQTLLFFFSYGHVFDFFSLHIKKFPFRHRHLLIPWTLAEIFTVWSIIKTSSNLETYTVFLNIMSAILVVISFVQIGINKFSNRDKWKITGELLITEAQVKGNNKLHDIYYIIVDGYACSNTFRDIYNYDNHEFINRLKEKGFFVADKSRSNYAMTMLSLASSLNLDYIHSLINSSEVNHRSMGATKQMIEENFAMRYIKSKGYKVIFLGSGFGVTQRNGHADLEIKCGQIDETLGRFINSTLIQAIASRTHLFENDKRRRILCMFSQLVKVCGMEGPKFVFAHIPSPQWPFLFHSNGSPTHWNAVGTEKRKEAYLNQVIFIEKKIVDLIDKLLSKSKNEPIIILQSDHGPNFAFDGGYEEQNPPQEILLEKMRILNAYYLPGDGHDIFYKSVTPVNTFRLIYNRYFDSKFPLVNDQSYYSTLEYPYRFSDVTPFVLSD